MKHPLPSGRPTGPPYIDSVTSGSTAGILSGLATKTFATATPNVGITGTEHEIRELRAQTEDLRSRLILVNIWNPNLVMSGSLFCSVRILVWWHQWSPFDSINGPYLIVLTSSFSSIGGPYFDSVLKDPHFVASVVPIW